MSETETVTPFAALVQGFTPRTATVTNGKRLSYLAPSGEVWKMKDIDALAGGRNNFIIVIDATGDKKARSIAEKNYPLYGKVGEPTVTVQGFIKSYPTQDGGVTRARASLLWDLDRGFVKVTTL